MSKNALRVDATVRNQTREVILLGVVVSRIRARNTWKVLEWRTVLIFLAICDVVCFCVLY
jgi:hypothetical protein